MKQIYKIIFLLFIATTGLLAQNNDCIDALPICTTSSQNFPSGNSGSGTADPGLNVGCATESQSSWYYFTVTTGGTLTFVIDPVNNSTDYDFALYLSPYGSPANPATDCNGSNELGAPVRCNFSGTTGNTGLSTTATNASEPSSGPTFSSALTVTTGQVYYLMINNYSGDGYPFSFYANTGNTAVLSCTGVTTPTSPCTCTTPTCANAFHATESAATSENGTVTTGADCTLFSPVIPVEQDGSTDMTFCADYTIPVGTTLAAFTTGGQFKYVSGGSCTGSIINRSVYASGSCGAALISTGNVTSGGFPIYAVTPGATYVFCQTIRLAGPDCLQYNSSCINVFSVPAPPANDQCAGAVAITACPSSTAGTTINATTTNDPTVTCNGETVDAPGVWYTYTNVATQSVTLDTDNATTNFDTKIHVYTAAGVCTGPYTCVTADDDAGAGTTSLVSFTAVGGTTYYILVNGVSGATGNFALDINCTTAPVNDACSGALTLACGSTLTGQNNTAATSTEDGLVCGTTVGATSRGMWYKIVGDGRIATLTTTSLTGSEITVWTGSDCSSLTCLSGVLGTTHTFTAEAGTTYYVLASTNAGGASTAFSIGLTCADPAYNVGGGTTGGGTAFCNGNNYLGSTTALPERTMVVTALTGTLRDPGGTGNYANSTDTRGTPTVICPNGGDGGTMTFTFSSFATESGIDLVYVYDGPTYRYPQVAGSPFSGTNLPSSITSTNATGCLTFEFYSDGSVVNTGFQGTWTSSGDTGVDIVPNDDCSNAIPVGIECPTVSGTNINATASCSDPTSSFFAALTLENTVWFKFTATAADAGATIVTLNNIICPDFVNNGLAATSRGLQMGVYNAGTGGSCPPATINDVSATRVASASAVGVTTLSTGSFTTVAGNTYYIGIDGNAASSCEWDITIDRYATNFAVNSATSGSYSYTCDAAPAQTADVALTLSGGRTAGYSITVVPTSISVTNSGSVYTLNNIPDGTTWTATATDGLCTQIISGTYDYNLTCNPCPTYSKNEVDITPATSAVCAGATVAMTTAVDATRSVPTVRAATLGGRKYGDGVGGTAPLNYVADYKKYIQLLPFSTMNATTIGTGVSDAQINGLDFTINAKWNDMYIALKNTSCAGSVVIWNGVNNTAFAGGTDATVSTGSTTLTYSAATGLFTPNTSISSYSSTATLAAMNTAFAGCNPQGFYLEFNDQSSAVLQYSINNFLFSVTDKTTTAITPTTTLTNITWVGSGAATGGTSGSHTNIAELTLSNSDKNATFTAPPCAGPSSCVYTYTITGKDVNGCTVTGTTTITVNPLPDITLTTTAASVCRGTTSTTLAYTATANSPNQYSIDYDAAANTAGFVDVTNATLPASPITLTVPAVAAAGTYNATLTVRNSTTGCVSAATAITVTVHALPAPPTLSNASYCVGNTATALDATASGATGYLWSNAATTASITPSTASAGTTTYTVTVTGSGGCTATRSATITVSAVGNDVNDITLCAGAAASSFSSTASCPTVSTPGTTTATGSGGTSEATTYGGAGNTNITVTVPALPAGAVVTSTNVTISFTANSPSYRSELRAEATPPVAVGSAQSDLQPSVLASAGTVTNAPLGTWGTGNPVGNWLFRFRETTNDSSPNPDANITNITITVNYTYPAPQPYQWFTVATGGTAVQTGTTFNPINDAEVLAAGAPYSSLNNTNTPGTYTFYAACTGSTCREPVTYTINAKPVITAGLTQTLCSGTAASRSITLSTDLPGTETFAWNAPTMTAGISGGTAGTGSTITDVLSNSGGTAGTATYTVTVTADAADGGCTNTANVVITVNPNPTITLSSSSTAVCSGTTSATLAYSATTGTPNQYSVDYDATAEGQGFVDVTNSTLPATPITLTVPAGAAPGTYNAAITVRNSTTGCVSTIYNVTVTVNDLPTITLGTSPTICSGTTTANLPYTATTNSPNQYSIDFNAAANTAGLSDVALTTLPASPIAITVPAGIAPGTYTGTITVKNTTTGCSSTATTFTLTVNATPSITSVTTACTGMTYDITVNATTASGTLEYSLDGGAYQPSNIFTALASGSTHSVTVRTVGTTCTATQSGITRDCSCAAPPAVTITEASVEVCGTAVATFNYTVANGPANVTETGAGTLSTTSLANGTGTFTYTPAAGDIGSTIVVTATIPDPDGVGSCVAATDAVDVVVKAIPAITVGTLTNPTTCGGTNGSIALNFTNVPDGTYTVSFTGGSGSASVSVSGGTGTISGLAAGTYSGFQITVNGCTNTATGTATLSDPTTPTITLSSTSTSVCSGTTSATLAYTATTGTPDQYSINYDATAEGQGFVDVNSAALPASPITLTVPAGAAAGTYNATITVRNSTTGCVSSVQNITVVVNSLPTAGITNNTGSTVLGCPPVGVSSVSVTATGGGTYSWSGGATPSTAANTFTTADTYTVTVTVSGCPSTASITITGTTTVPSAPTGTLAITNSTCSGCAVSGGSIAIGTVSGSGGTLEYSTDGGTTWSSSLPSYAPPQTIIASILASNGCRSATTAVGTTVAGVCTTPDAPTGTLAIANSTCSSCAVSGGSIAIGTVSGSGGTLEYSTDGGTTWSSSLPSYAPPQTIIASVLASNGCRSATTAVGTTVAGVCTTPAAPTGTLAITNSTCSSCAVSGGSIAIGTVSGSGGTLEYSTDGGTTWSSSIPTYNQTGPAQTIIASVLASNGCRSATTAVGTTVPGTCTTPTAPVVGLITQPTCSTATGSVALSGLPASGTWTITTSPGGTTTTGTGTSTTISGLVANTYTFTVTNATGCTSAASTSATIDPQPATPSITSTPTTCTGSTYTITVNATVSSGTLEYSIDGGAYQTSNSFTGLANGSTHSVTVRTVGTTCTATATGITATCACPAPPAVSITETTLSTCGTTSVTINYSVTNGPATLTSTGTGTFSTTTLNNGTGTATYTPSAGDAGTTVTLTATIPDPDGAGICASATDAVAVTVNARPAAVAGVGSSIACGGNINLTATPSGATSYSWAGPGGYTANVQNPVRTTATASMAGIYTVTVTGTNGCTASATTNVSVGACSFAFRISDPCSCLNNATTLTNGQFSEVVTVFGPAGFVVRAESITGLYQTSSTALVTVPFSAPATMTYNGSTGYILQGVHVDNVGYTVIAGIYEADGVTPVDLDPGTAGVQNTMTVSNKCAYPNPDYAFVSSNICSHPNNNVDLSAIITHSSEGSGTATFSGTGVVGSTFSSTVVGIGGPYPITMTYTGTAISLFVDTDNDGIPDANSSQISPDNGTTPAYPGCTQPVVKSISVINCCDADDGTW